MSNLRRMRRSQMNDGQGAKRVSKRLKRKLSILELTAEFRRQITAAVIGAKQSS